MSFVIIGVPQSHALRDGSTCKTSQTQSGKRGTSLNDPSHQGPLGSPPNRLPLSGLKITQLELVGGTEDGSGRWGVEGTGWW